MILKCGNYKDLRRSLNDWAAPVEFRGGHWLLLLLLLLNPVGWLEVFQFHLDVSHGVVLKHLSSSQSTCNTNSHLLLQDAVFRFDVTACPGSETEIISSGSGNY